jgi:hypothetical protein
MSQNEARAGEEELEPSGLESCHLWDLVLPAGTKGWATGESGALGEGSTGWVAAGAWVVAGVGRGWESGDILLPSAAAVVVIAAILLSPGDSVVDPFDEDPDPFDEDPCNH